MAQVKIFGLKKHLQNKRQFISEAIHECVTSVLGLPPSKKAHRFFGMEEEDFFMPEGRSDQYIIIEISLIKGRLAETKKQFIRDLFCLLETKAGILPMDVEICIFEEPSGNWGFRGFVGDEVTLDYRIDI